MLRHCLGAEGQSQYLAIQNVPAVGVDDFEKAIARLNKRFGSEKGLAVARMEFASRRQREGETFREFAAALRNLASKCKFPRSADDAILTQLTVHTTSEAVREKLLSMKDDEGFQSAASSTARAETNDRALQDARRGRNNVFGARNEDILRECVEGEKSVVSAP